LAGFADSPYFLGVLLISAFTMPIVFMVWIRNTARYGREPWRNVIRAFLWGAVFSVIVAVIFSLILAATLGQVGPLNTFLIRRFHDPDVVFLIIGALIVAPIVEEAAKGLGVHEGRPEIQGLLDGLVYGAAAGLGFSATENLIYGVNTLLSPDGGATASLAVIAIRSFSSSFLHASSSATFGYGLAKAWLTRRTWAFVPYYLLAVIMHSTFNLLTTIGVLYATPYGETVGFVAAVAFALVAITIVRLKLAAHPRTVAGNR